MGSETIKLPIFNFSELIQGSKSPNWESVKNQVKFSLQEFGCFEATYDQIPQNLRNSVFEGLKKLFELPLQNKLQNKSNKLYHGYIGQHAKVPLYESLGIDNALDDGSIESFTNLMWPEGNHDFSKSIQSFSEQLSELDQIVRKMVLESLELEKYVDEQIQSTNYLIRVQKYDPPKSHETELGLPAHTDKNMVTILYQNEAKGLEVQTKDGRWISAQSSPNSFIVMTGESFHAWTNGRLHSPQHRVMMRGDVVRYSIAIFSVPREGYIIKAPEEMIDEEHPLLFKPFDYSKFLDFYYKDMDQKSFGALKAYCGA
ncbi:probable 2-oxoglutarate-dependent dioxygenase AOP1 [Primulina huaijiensis]|uniref:probable 2-oxoglutarate-dependent dioxygenase AOP1 n=1 Tax=Primulina huaijiensis TaxID=1492673 RepID=UPI003CC6F2FC